MGEAIGAATIDLEWVQAGGRFAPPKWENVNILLMHFDADRQVIPSSVFERPTRHIPADRSHDPMLQDISVATVFLFF
jgi:hypothetical protein